MGRLSLCFFMYIMYSSALSLSLFAHSTSSLCHDEERSALLRFKESILTDKFASQDPSAYSKVESWNWHISDCCLWDGVKCNNKTGHVIRLDLTSSCLYGSINSTSTLFHLVHLQWLSLADNNLNLSKIPAAINKLSKLSHLDLSSSSISGQIPSEMLELSYLESLYLSGNFYLELQKPGLGTLVDKLTNLREVDLSQVNISSSVPKTLANLSSLTHLSLQACELKGEFPAKVFQLPHLSFLNLRYNRDLTGYIPKFEKSSPLAYVSVGGCYFSGTIPSSLDKLTSLVYLEFSANNFSGELPTSIGNLASLKELYIDYNNFSGQVPSSLGNLTQLSALDLSYNKFLGQNSSSLSWIAKQKELTYLGLAGMSLFGELPSSLMNLTQLTLLNMDNNQLTGPIPYWLMNLNQISALQLMSNQLTGQIPSQISNLTQLNFLRLSSNKLQGLIPSSIFELKNLKYLVLSSNNLSGTVELEMFLHKFKSLEVLALSSNNLTLLTQANVNSTSFQQKFTSIGLSSCNLREFPDFLRNQEQLMELDLSSNKLSGQIPSWLFNLSIDSLSSLNLSHNFFIGFDQQPVLLPWNNLITIDLRCNKLQGPLPVPPLSISTYLVSKNKLTGEIPPWLCHLPYLYALDLSDNNLRGVLPRCLGNLHYLSVLQLQDNKFHGSIPESFVNGTKLRMIDLSNNLLQGIIPRSLANCSMLEFLDLGNNRISDTFPAWLGILSKLEVLILRSNRLHGVIKEPETEFEFLKLRIIDLSHNRFTGKLPSKYFQCWNAMKVVNASQLTYMQDELMPTVYIQLPYYSIDYDYSLTMSNKGLETKYGKISNLLTSIILSNNRFIGEIPVSIANLKGLRNLNLSNNNLHGHIPSSLGNLTVVESLDMSNNSLSGEIPQQLAELSFLAVFNVSHNHLTGHIPQERQFSTFENSSFDGNPGLCGKPLSRKCENSEPREKEETEEWEESPFGLDWKVVTIGYANGMIIGLVLGYLFCTRKYEWFVKIYGMRLNRIEIRRTR
ncbi:hypothetical protein ACOSQ2_031160 [Xanthoceras sorbifolium]